MVYTLVHTVETNHGSGICLDLLLRTELKRFSSGVSMHLKEQREERMHDAPANYSTTPKVSLQTNRVS